MNIHVGHPLLDPGSGLGKALSERANCCSRLSTVYSPKLAGEPETTSQTSHNQQFFFFKSLMMIFAKN